MRRMRVIFAVLAAIAVLQAALFAAEKVSARTETVVIPTFEIDKGSPAPALFNEDSYAAYPRTMLDVSSRSEKPVDKEYQMAVLENGLIRVEVNPAVGGRIWRIIDKKSGRNLLWTNDAVKPISVGRRRGWIAGGIEFPFPVGNHGEDTMQPYRTTMRENEDGSATVTVMSFDHFYRFWGSYDITVAPDDARMTLTVRLYNPTLVRNRYQIWVNAAVKTGDDMQFVFPVDWVAGHGFGGIHPWPMWEDGKYDHSYWKNQKDALGVFGWNADFMGAYYYGEDYGIIRYCPHTLAEGIKLWTWGTGSRWTTEYSISQGSYNEIQGGRWPTQEMYGWLEPHQMDTWTEYWYPVSGLKGVDAASKDAAMSVKIVKSGKAPKLAEIRLNALKGITGTLTVSSGDRTLVSRQVEIAAGAALNENVGIATLGDEDTLSVRLVDKQGFTVISYDRPIAPAASPKPELPTTVKVDGKGPDWDELAAGLSAEVNDGDPEKARGIYEGLAKDNEGFAAAWKALGILRYKQLDTAGAREALAKAVELDAKDAEARYYLGIAKLDLKEADAIDTLKSVADDVRFTHVAKFAIGVAALESGNSAAAVETHKEASRGWSNDPVLFDYLAVAARLAGDKATAEEALAAAFAAEPLDPFAAVERLVAAGGATEEAVQAALGTDEDLYIETAFFYDSASQAQTALSVAKAGEGHASSGLYYYQLAYLAGRSGSEALAKEYVAKAASMGTDYVFPHRREDAAVFEKAASLGSEPAYGKFYEATMLQWLGRGQDALDIWTGLVGEASIPGLRRRVADAYFNGRLRRDFKTSIEAFRDALVENPDDVEAYWRLDDLYEIMQAHEERGQILEEGLKRFPDDDQLTLRMARYLTSEHKAADAAELMENHKFHRVHQAYGLMHIGRQAVQDTYASLAMEALRNKDKKKALEYLQKAADARRTLENWFD
jgi:tetratricopeptide (TPR) repeat protein